MAEDTLVEAVLGLPRSVVTFDPPGAFRSVREARCDLQEMLGAACEALDVAGVPGPVDVVGHSMGAFCALALALDHPERVARLVLVGVTGGGWGEILRSGGLPFGWAPWDPRFWQYVTWGIRLGRGRGSLALHKRHVHLADAADHVRPELVRALRLEPGDEHRPPPVRTRWIQHVSGLSLMRRLGEIEVPCLICAGAHDRTTPPRANRRVASRIRGSTLVVFAQSGHAPFEEEPERFRQVVADFLTRTSRADATTRPARRATPSAGPRLPPGGRR